MNTCPTCNHSELEGTIFCSNCGAPLLSKSRPVITSMPAAQHPQPVPAPSPPVIAFRILGTGRTIQPPPLLKFTLGRASQGSPAQPDIDLSPYSAYEDGVSRLHLSVTISGGKAFVSDLGSVNGTQLNGSPIQPGVSVPLFDGDNLSLGKFQLWVSIKTA